MGKGDRRTRRGKIFRGTYGVTRLKKKKKQPEKPVEGAKAGKPDT
jgi:30S ribosomal protein S31